MLVMAGVVALALFVVVARHRSLLSRSRIAAAAAFAAGALMGARVLGTLNGDWSVEALFAPTAHGFSIWGGVAGGVIAVAVFAGVYDRAARDRGRPLFDTGTFSDLLAPAVGAGIAVARVGCWFAGCCFGLPTTLPWGVHYPPGSNAHIAYVGTQGSLFSSLEGPPAVHPIPLYEIAVALSGVVIALWVWRRFVRTGRLSPGSSAAAFVIWYAGWRAILESVRHESAASLLPGWGWQIVFGAICAAGIVWLVKVGARPVSERRPAPMSTRV